MGDDTDKYEAWEKEARRLRGGESKAIKALQWTQPKTLKAWTAFLGSLVVAVSTFIGAGYKHHRSVVDDERALVRSECEREANALRAAQDVSKAEYMRLQEQLVGALNERIESCEDLCGR